jgi:hypothetical protein
VFVDVQADVREDEGDLAETVIKFEAIVYKVQTLADGGIRLTLDMPETAIPQMAMLAETKREGVPLVFEARVQH